MEFGDIADMMVLGTLVAFIFVCIGAVRLKLLNPILPVIGAFGCIYLACHLNPMVLQAYAITCPFGLLIYGFYGYKHSRLRNQVEPIEADAPPASPPPAAIDDTDSKPESAAESESEND